MRFQEQRGRAARHKVSEADVEWFLRRMALVREAEARLRDEIGAIVDEDGCIVVMRAEPSLKASNDRGAYR